MYTPFMQNSEKFASDLSQWLNKTNEHNQVAQLARLRDMFFKECRALPEDANAAFFTIFLSKFKEDKDVAHTKSLQYLMAIVAIVLDEYNNQELSVADWKDLREIISDAAGEINIDLLTTILALALDHKAF